MHPLDFYLSEQKRQETILARYQKKKSSFAWLRLGSIAGLFLAFFYLWSVGFIWVAAGSILMLFIFIRLVHADLDNQLLIRHTKKLIAINENEIKSLKGDFSMFPQGNEQITKDHPYSHDLDIFGKASLFQYVGRTTSEMGAHQLGLFLKSASPVEEIVQRQEAIQELGKKVLWIQQMQAEGKKDPITFSTRNRLLSWMDQAPVFSGFKPWKWLRYVLPAAVLSILALYIADYVNNTVFYATLLLFAILAYQINKVVAPVHDQLSRMADELQTLSLSIQRIEKESFDSPLLKSWQAVYVSSKDTVSGNIYSLKKIMNRLDLRYNMVLSLPLNLFLLWNLQQMLDLEKWRERQQENVALWFDTLGLIEALNSFGVLHFNHPEWAFPQIRADYFSISGTDIGHPLIPEAKRVNNPVHIGKAGELMLITGSNMAGKSTYLRSIGVNTVLAMAGAPVCAKSFSISHVQLVTSMRITDNLEESTSTFYAELKKLKSIIDKVNQRDRVFILLDEILRGTNSLDRHLGSKALIKQLVQKKAATIIATHDLELARIKQEYPDEILNYHFDVQVEKEELYFDYKLKPGVCTSLNASILMRKIGIELNA